MRVSGLAADHHRTGELRESDADATTATIGPLIASLYDPISPEQLIERAAKVLAPLGAVGGALIIVDEHGHLASMSTTGLSSTVAPRLGATVVDGGFPAMAALREGRPLWLGSREQVARRFPVFSAIPAGWQAYAALPLRHGPTIVGSAAIPFDCPQEFNGATRVTIEAVTGVLGAAVHATRSAARPTSPGTCFSESSYLLDGMIDGMIDGAIIVDHRLGRITYANHAALEMFGIESIADLDMPIGEVAARFGVSYQRPPLPHAKGSSSAVITIRSAAGIERVVRAHASETDSQLHQLIVFIDTEPIECSVILQRSSDMRDALLEDRKRVARDLHDGAIQTVFATSLTLAALALESPEPLRQRIEEAIDGLDHVVTQLRSTVFDLRRRTAGSASTRISELVAAIGGTLPTPPILTVIGDLDTLRDEQMLVEHLEFALREALSNAARHAQATDVAIGIQVTDEVVAFSVHDNGIGFADGVPEGDGLDNLRTRAASLGGDCRWESVLGVGTVVHWSLSRRAHRASALPAQPMAS